MNEIMNYSVETERTLQLRADYRGDLYEIILVDNEAGGYGAILNWNITFKLPGSRYSKGYVYDQIKDKGIFEKGCRAIEQLIIERWFR